MIYRDTVDKELERNKRLISDSKARDRIKAFSADLKVEEGLTNHRVIFYIIRLRTVYNLMPDTFLNPTKQSIKELITKVSERDVSPRTIEDYKQAIRKFYSWHLTRKAYNQNVAWVRVRNNVNRLKKPEQMITSDEMQRISDNLMNVRDKALFSLMYDSGARIGEILTMKIEDLGFDQYGAKCRVSGKTGFRTIRIVGDSVAFLRDWIKTHPNGSNPESWLFVGIAGNNYGQQMEYDQVRSSLRKACKRAGITKRIHPHLFRHSRATELSSVLSDTVLKSHFGWSGSSRMAGVYTHINDTETDNAILKAHGIQVTESRTLETAKFQTCTRCHSEMPSYAKICSNCFMILDQATAIKTEFSMDVELDKKQDKEGWVTGKINNYDEIKPLLLIMQEMQKSIDELKKQIKQ